jgi:CRISPR-associated endonuclease/helicase Cas3
LPERLAKKLFSAGAMYELAGKFVIETSNYHPTWGIQAPDSLLSATGSVI